jgi:hypothetical protein
MAAVQTRDTDPQLNVVLAECPYMDAYVLPTLSDAELNALVTWTERFVGVQFQPFVLWFGDVLLAEQSRRVTGADPKRVRLPVGNCKEATASGLLGSFLLVEFSKTAALKALTNLVHRHFVIVAFSELVSKE